MIFVSGFGQLCNNILQYGHLYAWGKENGLSVIALRFCYKYKYFKINETKYYNWLTYIFAKYANKLHLIPTVSFLEEKDFNPENLRKLRTNKFSFVKGWYLKDFDAFLKYKEELKELFSFKKEIIEKVNLKLPVKQDKLIRLGVHIRRGDYIRWMNGNYFYTDEEYLNCILSFLYLFQYTTIEIIIVSNDKELKKDLFRKNIPSTICFMAGNPAEDLYALSTCNYIIGPPSTFSLMASFYKDANLYWILNKNHSLTLESFKKFDYLFRHII